jgi:hypothetical protein
VNYRDRTAAAAYGAWNPGLESDLPREYLPLATIFRRENVSTSAAKAHELRDYCGLPPHELVAFRPERLIVHELLLRVASSLAVPDGPDQEDLGRNFRRMASTILDKHIAPHRIQLTELFERLRSAALAVITQELEASLCPRLGPAGDAGRPRPNRWPFRFGKRKKPPLPAAENAEQRERRIMAEWSERAQGAGGRLEQARRVEQDCNGDHGAARPAVGEQRPADRACRHTGLQRLRQRGHRRCDRAVYSASGFARRIPAAAAAGAAGSHERQRRVRLRQEHDAAAAAHPGEEARISVGGVCANQPRYLA